jgi:hypothetical protein
MHEEEFELNKNTVPHFYHFSQEDSFLKEREGPQPSE